MKISRNIYDLLQSEDLAVRDDYSGRYMYGDRCFGIDVDNPATAVYSIVETLRRIVEYHASEPDTVEEAEGLIKSDCWLDSKMDSMGLGYIVYFPDIQVEEED